MKGLKSKLKSIHLFNELFIKPLYARYCARCRLYGTEENSPCTPAAYVLADNQSSFLLQVHQTYSKELHYSLLKVS